MPHNRTTTKIDIRIPRAEEALENLLETASQYGTNAKELEENASIIQLVLKVCEHKLHRLEDLEAQVAHLKTKTSILELREDVELVTHAVDLESELSVAKERIAKLENYIRSIVGDLDDIPSEFLQETGTD